MHKAGQQKKGNIPGYKNTRKQIKTIFFAWLQIWHYTSENVVTATLRNTIQKANLLTEGAYRRKGQKQYETGI